MTKSGMRRVLIVSPSAEPGGNSLEAFYERAFAELGLATRIAPILRSGALQDLGSRIRTRVERFLQNGLAPDLYPRDMIASARQFAPHATFVVRGERLSAEAVRALDQLSPAGCYNIYPDHPFVIPGRGAHRLRESLGEYRAVFTFSRALCAVFRQLGARQAHWLPFGFDPQTHRPAGNGAAPAGGIAYFGAWGPIQEWWLNQLSEFELRIYGTGWQKLAARSPIRSRWMRNEGIGPAMGPAVASADLVFNLIRAEHGCAHSMKTFELPACGGVVIVNRTSEQRLFFREDLECVYFDTKEELADKIRFYRANPSARQRIREAALEAVRAHSYRVRAEDLLRFAESGMMQVESRYGDG